MTQATTDSTEPDGSAPDTLPWDDIASHLGITRQSAIESCKRGLANLDPMTEHEVEMLHMQVEQVIADVRTGDLDKDKAGVMLKGLGMLAKLKGFEPGQKVEHQHAHAHAHAVVDNVERFQSLLGEVAAREVQRRQAALTEPEPDDADDTPAEADDAPS